MQLSKRTQYGIRALICLADAYESGFLQTKNLTTREKLPTKFLESILLTLTRGKFLVSRIGVMGGYRLARPPKDILISDIISRLEGDEFLDTAEPDSNERPGEIGVRIVQTQLTMAICEVLDSVSIADLAEQVSSQTRGGQMYYI